MDWIQRYIKPYLYLFFTFLIPTGMICVNLIRIYRNLFGMYITFKLHLTVSTLSNYAAIVGGNV